MLIVGFGYVRLGIGVGVAVGSGGGLGLGSENRAGNSLLCSVLGLRSQPVPGPELRPGPGPGLGPGLEGVVTEAAAATPCGVSVAVMLLSDVINDGVDDDAGEASMNRPCASVAGTETMSLRT